ncbi:MAG TPA: gamma carbonic anhydrase family protein [Candidatus Pygmaiobacter gallistercoris]|nr:gamma carbonic anhydrase family protein [Candidatus Pygmaiobacter gallistercoris]
MKQPVFGKETRVAPGAVVLGEVDCGEGVSVWYNAVVRADAAPIHLGAGCNLQDGCILHVDAGHPIRLGDGVSVGHGAILHGCAVGGNTIVGMGAILLNGCVVGENCLIGAGALVTEGTVIPDGSVAFGSPARVIRPIRPEEIAHNRSNAAHYRALARQSLPEAD